VSDVFVISECCPVGCGGEVVALRDCRSSAVFVYCDACGCTWATPEAAQLDSGLEEITGPEERAPAGVAYPTVAEIMATPFGGKVLRSVPQSTWRLDLGELNAYIERRLSERNLPPA
jgi:hypothetical protein